MPPVFPFFGHALGSLSRDLEMDVVYTQSPSKTDRKLIQEKLGVLGEPIFFGAASSYLIGSGHLKAGVLYDPTYNDHPELLEEPKMYDAYGLKADAMTDKAKRMLAYSWLVDEGLEELHRSVPIAFVAAQHGSRTQRTASHHESLQHVDDALATLESLYQSEDVGSLRYKNYKRYNYNRSPAKIMVGFLRACLVMPKSIQGLDSERRQRLSDVAKLALGYEKISDQRLFGLRMWLTEESLEEQVALLPKKLQAGHRKNRPDDLRASAF